MELTTTQIPAATKITGEVTDLVVNAGQRFIIESSPGGEDILGSTIPEGKRWKISVSVSIDEEVV